MRVRASAPFGVFGTAAIAEQRRLFGPDAGDMLLELKLSTLRRYIETNDFSPGSASARHYLQQITGLINLVNQFETKSGVAATLDATLQSAQASFSKGNKTAGDNQINSFINGVNAQAGKSLAAANATTLIRLATAMKQ